MVTPRISFEFFPPQSLDASFRLWETVQALAPMKPSFVSVTYGAGGTTRTLTHEAVSTIHRHYRLPVAAHLTCVDATQTETLAIAESYAAASCRIPWALPIRWNLLKSLPEPASSRSASAPIRNPIPMPPTALQT
jgi:5,10-methylenetetrahydrofolate reductase